jgi:phosphohistidine phosphatase
MEIAAMKTVYIVRHGAAEPYGSKPDYERELVTKGIKKSRRMAERFLDAGIAPGLFISSPAPRALSTAMVFAEVLNMPVESIITDRVLYEQDLHAYSDILASCDDAVDTVFVFGHNPSLSDFSEMLAPEFNASMPKSSVVGVSFDTVSWSDTLCDTGSLVLFGRPDDPDSGPVGSTELPDPGRKELAKSLASEMTALLNTVDPSAAKKLRKPIRKAGRTIAKKFQDKR